MTILGPPDGQNRAYLGQGRVGYGSQYDPQANIFAFGTHGASPTNQVDRFNASQGHTPLMSREVSVAPEYPGSQSVQGPQNNAPGLVTPPRGPANARGFSTGSMHAIRAGTPTGDMRRTGDLLPPARPVSIFHRPGLLDTGFQQCMNNIVSV